jgi:hypothetical protein
VGGGVGKGIGILVGAGEQVPKTSAQHLATMDVVVDSSVHVVVNESPEPIEV